MKCIFEIHYPPRINSYLIFAYEGIFFKIEMQLSIKQQLFVLNYSHTLQASLDFPHFNFIVIYHIQTPVRREYHKYLQYLRKRFGVP